MPRTSRALFLVSVLLVLAASPAHAVPRWVKAYVGEITAKPTAEQRKALTAFRAEVRKSPSLRLLHVANAVKVSTQIGLGTTYLGGLAGALAALPVASAFPERYQWATIAGTAAASVVLLTAPFKSLMLEGARTDTVSYGVRHKLISLSTGVALEAAQLIGPVWRERVAIDGIGN